MTTQIAIARPIETVWKALVDLERYCDWNPYMSRIDGKAVPGATIEVHTRSDEADAPPASYVVVVSASPYCMHWQGGAEDRSEFMGDHFFELVETGNFDTLLRHFELFSGTRLNEFGPAHEAAVQRNFERFNTGLKAFCEARS